MKWRKVGSHTENTRNHLDVNVDTQFKLLPVLKQVVHQLISHFEFNIAPEWNIQSPCRHCTGIGKHFCSKSCPAKKLSHTKILNVRRREKSQLAGRYYNVPSL